MTRRAVDRGNQVRVLIDQQPASGAWNMAVDAYLLQSAVETGCCSLRWYRWEEPTLSLGYFQQPDDPLIEERFAALPRVRRLSGGGAILHDRELTYSCAVGADHPLAARPAALYQAMHKAIAGVLSEWGTTLKPRGETNRALDANFLCFHRGDANDLVLGTHKVLGSAQRRRRGAVLQHGSLLLQRSALAPEFPGILDLNEIPLTADQILQQLVDATRQILAPDGILDELTLSEREQISTLAAASGSTSSSGDHP